jgi:hypothetical protein
VPSAIGIILSTAAPAASSNPSAQKTQTASRGPAMTAAMPPLISRSVVSFEMIASGGPVGFDRFGKDAVAEPDHEYRRQRGLHSAWSAHAKATGSGPDAVANELQ